MPKPEAMSSIPDRAARDEERLDDNPRGPFTGFVPGAKVVPIESAPSAPARSEARTPKLLAAGANDPKPDWRHEEETILLGFEGIETSREKLKNPTRKDDTEGEMGEDTLIDPQNKVAADIGVALVRAVSARKRRQRRRPTPTPAEVMSEPKANIPPPPPRPRRS